MSAYQASQPFVQYEPDISAHPKRYLKEVDWQALLAALREIHPAYAKAFSEVLAQPYFYNYNIILARKPVLAKHTNRDEKYWEERILGLGSPKFDKVAESKKEDFKLPEEWERIIRGRKTVLYNTGLTAMLEHKDKFIEKIKSVLETFRAQEDVVLWWRPHPLLRSTFQSMHPELLGEYDEIVNSYRQEGWGIYDDTSELERAVAWTDGYYGDTSSVVQLYEKTGKMIMIQHIADPEETDVN